MSARACAMNTPSDARVYTEIRALSWSSNAHALIQNGRESERMNEDNASEFNDELKGMPYTWPIQWRLILSLYVIFTRIIHTKIHKLARTHTHTQTHYIGLRAHHYGLFVWMLCM